MVFTDCGRLFFCSSRRRNTRLQSDWSSDVCSSDLQRNPGEEDFILIVSMVPLLDFTNKTSMDADDCERALARVERQYHPPSSRRFEDGDWVRSEERRVGKSVCVGWRRSMK